MQFLSDIPFVVISVCFAIYLVWLVLNVGDILRQKNILKVIGIQRCERHRLEPFLELFYNIFPIQISNSTHAGKHLHNYFLIALASNGSTQHYKSSCYSLILTRVQHDYQIDFLSIVLKTASGSQITSHGQRDFRGWLLSNQFVHQPFGEHCHFNQTNDVSFGTQIYILAIAFYIIIRLTTLAGLNK